MGRGRLVPRRAIPNSENGFSIPRMILAREGLRRKGRQNVCLGAGGSGYLCSRVTKNDEEPTSFTLVGNSAGLPAPIRRPSPAIGHDAEILEG